MASLLEPPPPPGYPPSFPPSPGRGADDAFGLILILSGALLFWFAFARFMNSWKRGTSTNKAVSAQLNAALPPPGEQAVASYNGQSFFANALSTGMRMPELQDASFRRFVDSAQ